MAKKKKKTSFPSDSEHEESHTRKGKEGMEDNPPPLTETDLEIVHLVSGNLSFRTISFCENAGVLSNKNKHFLA